MTNFSFDETIPAAANNPSVDQASMQTNFASTKSLLNVDHISFSVNDGGEHKQVTFNNKNAAGVQTDPKSTVYTASGTASTKADLRFRNENGIFPLSYLRAYGRIDGTGGYVGQVFNISSVAHVAGTGTYTVTLTAGATSSSFYGVVIGTESAGANDNQKLFSLYEVTGTTTFVIRFFKTSNNIGFDPSAFTFQVIEI